MRALAVATALIASTIASGATAEAKPEKMVFTDTAMGTVVSVFFWGEPSEKQKYEKAAGDVFAEMKRLDGVMTTWTDTSEIGKVNLAAGKAPVVVSDETFEVITRAQDVSKRSGGVFDITVQAFHGLWKFDQDMDGTLPDPAEVKKRLAMIGWKHLKLDPKKKTVFIDKKGMAITLGGIAKGYAVDKCVAILSSEGFKDFMVQAGGDMYISGNKEPNPWVVGIRDPRGPADQMFAFAPIENHSFSTSGDYERGFVKDGIRYHHILDPRTGQPARASRSVTVRAKDSFTADAWSKVMFILGYEKASALIKKEKLEDFEVVWVDGENAVHMTPEIQKVIQLVRTPTKGP
ncbi:MAG TPA: FAD:protein FMN transferase [Kofleriaceae bacterium]|jgi:thiamine biosynthesis lipoprotein